MAQLFANNAFSTLSASLSAVATTLFVATGHGSRFPVASAPDFFYVTLEDAAGNMEIVKVTTHSAGNTSMVIARAQQGTAARAWAVGDLVELRASAAEMAQWESDIDALQADRARKAGETYSGSHDFTAAAVHVATASPGSSGNSPASLDFVNAAMTNATLPGQAGNAGKVMSTDGTSAGWATIAAILGYTPGGLGSTNSWTAGNDFLVSPTMPTPPADDNTNKGATTAFYAGQASSATPQMDGIAATGTSLKFARADHVHPSDTSLAGSATPLVAGAASAGTSQLLARQDHVHPTQAGSATPLIAGTAAAGTSSLFARQDHVHPLQTTAVTQVPDTNNTAIATCAFVVGQVGTASPAMNGVATVGASLRYSRQDHIHPIDTSRAPLASPALTGTPTVPTAVTGTNTTQAASTAFVQNQIAASIPWADTATGGRVRYSTNAEAQNIAGNNSTALTPYSLDQAYRGGNQSVNWLGWQRLPGGLIEQWTEVYLGDVAATNFSFTFPIAFPSFCASVLLTVQDTSGNRNVVACLDAAPTRFGGSGKVGEIDAQVQNVTIRVYAKGY